MCARSGASSACATCWKAASGAAAIACGFTGQLTDATSGAHIWADRFEGEIDATCSSLQDRITESVVAAIEPKLQLAEIERLKHKPAADLDAYDLLLQRAAARVRIHGGEPRRGDSTA